MIEVAAVILKNSAGQILICRRGAGGNCAYLWEFPGGKREPHETLDQCAVRECQEELGVHIALDGVYARSQFAYPDKEIAFTFYLGHIVSGSPVRTVHTEMCWVPPAQITQYDFCPADIEVIARLAQQTS